MNDSVLVSQTESQFTITLGDGLELADTPLLLEAARTAVGSGRSVVVDCRDLSFLSTAVVQILVALRRECMARKLSFEMTGVQDPAQAHLRRAGFETVLSSRV